MVTLKLLIVTVPVLEGNTRHARDPSIDVRRVLAHRRGTRRIRSVKHARPITPLQELAGAAKPARQKASRHSARRHQTEAW